MPAEMKCNMCGVALRVQEDRVGSIINCPSCGQVIFVQLPSEPSAASDTPPVSQETLALSSGLSEPELPDFLKPAAPAAPAAAELAPRVLAETDTVSSLAEMFESEEPAGAAIPRESPPPAVVPPESAIDLSFLTPKLDTAISLESSPPAPPSPESSPGAGMPWEPMGETAAPAPQSIFEPESKAAPVSPSLAISTPPQPAAAEFPWMPSGGSDEPATAQVPAPSPFDFTAPPVPAQQPARPPASPAPPAFVPPATPSTPPAQPEFFLPGVAEDRDTATAAALSTTAPSFTGGGATPAKPPLRVGILVATYVSGVIFGLIIGKFVFGKTAAAGGSGSSGLEAIRDDGMLKDKTKWVDPKAAVPSGQLKRLGETVQIAGLSVTARSVQRAKVTKVHSFGGSKETSVGECLVLHLLLKNTSKDVEFAPLDPMFVRPHNPSERPNYSYIEIPGGEPIGMFELHKFSEFDLEGQPFDAMKPGEEIEAIVAAAEDSPSKAKGTMRWRIQVRAGVPDQKPEKKAYTTVVGFEFTPEQIRG
jgi:hypothetical protein